MRTGSVYVDIRVWTGAPGHWRPFYVPERTGPGYCVGYIVRLATEPHNNRAQPCQWSPAFQSIIPVQQTLRPNTEVPLDTALGTSLTWLLDQQSICMATGSVFQSVIPVQQPIRREFSLS